MFGFVVGSRSDQREQEHGWPAPASQPLPPSLVQLEGDKGSRSPPRDLEAAGTETKILVELEEIHSSKTYLHHGKAFSSSQSWLSRQPNLNGQLAPSSGSLAST